MLHRTKVLGHSIADNCPWWFSLGSILLQLKQYVFQPSRQPFQDTIPCTDRRLCFFCARTHGTLGGMYMQPAACYTPPPLFFAPSPVLSLLCCSRGGGRKPLVGTAFCGCDSRRTWYDDAQFFHMPHPTCIAVQPS